MTELPMRDVDAEHPEVRRLRDAGWKHVGNDLWVYARCPNTPIRRDSALKVEEAFDRVCGHHQSGGNGGT